MTKTTPRATLLALCSTAVMTAVTYSTFASNIGVNPVLVAQAATAASTSHLTLTQAKTNLAKAEAAEKAAAKAKSVNSHALKVARVKSSKDRALLSKAEAYLKSHSKSKAAKQAVSRAKSLVAKDSVNVRVATAAENKANRAYHAAVSAVSAAKAALKQAGATGKAQVAKPSQTYKDGTYTGVGQTPIGAIQLQLTLKADKIVNVKITGATTHYPVSFIDPVLPNQLLQVQNPNHLNIVSGATLSTYDFYYAVEDCLQQAKKAEQAG